MSIEKEEKPIEIPKVEDDKPFDIVEDTMALRQSKIITQDKLIEELTAQLDELNIKYEQAKGVIEEQAKGELLAFIGPRYDMPDELLVLKTVDELKKLKADITKVVVPAFKAGTPITNKKESHRYMLETTFDRAQAERLGRNK